MSQRNQLGHDAIDKLTTKQLVERFNQIVPEEKKVRFFANRATALKRVRAAMKGQQHLVKVEKEENDEIYRFTFHYPQGTLVAELSRRASLDEPRKPSRGTPKSLARLKRVKRVTYDAKSHKLSNLHAGSIKRRVLDAIKEAGEKGILVSELSDKMKFRTDGFVQKLVEHKHVQLAYERPDEAENE